MSTTDFTVVAIIAAYNEGDVIGQVLRDLIEQGVSAYLIDHASTDDTVARAEPHLGRGLLGIERFPSEGAGVAATTDRFSWESILKRKEVLAGELEADWFIHHDADELRESPWAHLNLHDAIRAVDTLGYNAVEFELLNFWPTHDGFRPGDDMRKMFSYYSAGEPWDKVQIKCWKKTLGQVDLASSGGHEAIFPDRRVFPLRFLLRHYPIRGQVHGERKVFHERQARFVESERARGWHVQYDGAKPGQSFLRDPAAMIPYDPEVVRWLLILRHRGVEALEEGLAAQRLAREAASQELEKLQGQLATRGREVDQLQSELATRSRQVADLETGVIDLKSDLDARRREVDRLAVELAGRLRDNEVLRQELQGVGRALEGVCATRSWRWTAPLRTAFRLLGGR